MFPELHFLSPIDSSKLSDFSEKVDIIFATNYLENIPNINIPIIHVSPVMSIAEKISGYERSIHAVRKWIPEKNKCRCCYGYYFKTC